ncbi:hypothetical protein CEXT_368621 [Caerostris extrusa]|uniref:SMB domain-containing protein n=1 Tax=Caerostris extrusa TaxID=172846 RepID=A0AAV4MLL2_CAEEX|nr:hypothetical protein CEXT_368621 [Caerostris extrusa]
MREKIQFLPERFNFNYKGAGSSSNGLIRENAPVTTLHQILNPFHRYMDPCVLHMTRVYRVVMNYLVDYLFTCNCDPKCVLYSDCCADFLNECGNHTTSQKKMFLQVLLYPLTLLVNHCSRIAFRFHGINVFSSGGMPSSKNFAVQN